MPTIPRDNTTSHVLTAGNSWVDARPSDRSRLECSQIRCADTGEASKRRLYPDAWQLSFGLPSVDDTSRHATFLRRFFDCQNLVVLVHGKSITLLRGIRQELFRKIIVELFD